MKRTQPRRDWTDARAKVEREEVCRLGPDGCSGPLEAAHVVGREHDQSKPCSRCKGSGLDPTDAYADGDGVDNIEAPCRFCGHGGGEYVPGTGLSHVLHVHPDSIVPLCREHHTKYDAHVLDILPVLSLEEQLRAVKDAGGIELAWRRTAPVSYRELVAA